MATLSFVYNSSDNQIWIKNTNGGEGVVTWNAAIAGIPSGATVNSVTLTFGYQRQYNQTSRASIYSGNWTSATRIWTVTNVSAGVDSVTVDLSSYIQGNGTYRLDFYAKSATGTSNFCFSGPTITVTYTPAYTQCTAPTSVTVSPVTCAPGASATLSWSGAKAGTNMSITGYHVYRSTDGGATYSMLVAVTTSATSGSTTVVGPTTNGAAYKYKVYTIGSVSGYHSDGSTAVATLTCGFSSLTPPSVVRVSKCITTGEDLELVWTAATGGQNNNVVGYKVQYQESLDGATWSSESLYAELGIATSCTVSAPTPGYYRRYTVYGVGSVSNSVGAHSSYLVYHFDSGFTDETLTAGTTHIKAVHMTEIQDLVKVIYICYGKDAPLFTSIIAGETSLGGWTDHVNEIRTAFDVFGLSHEAWIGISVNQPRADVMQQLRDVLLGAEKPSTILGEAVLGATVL